jgi:hypothetical protein
MMTPTLRQIHPDPTLRTAACLEADCELYEVIRSGVFACRRYRAGDVIVVAEGAGQRGACVLVPGGVGRPVLGDIRDDGLYGSAGEKCNPVRWSPAGIVMEVWRRSGAGWGIAPEERVAPQTLVAMPGRLRVRGARATQLPLFSEAA